MARFLVFIFSFLSILPCVSSAHKGSGREVSFPLADVPGGLQRAQFWQSSDEKAVFLCLHGIQTHSGWFQPLGERLAASNVSTYALDRRGSGQWSVTATHPQYQFHAKARGDVVEWQTWLDDIRIAAQGIQKRHPNSPIYLLGVSWGAKTALGALTDDAGRSLFRGAIFISPAFATEIDPNFIMNAGQKILAASAPSKLINIGKKIGHQRYSPCPATHELWLKNDPALLQHVTHRFISQSQKQFSHAIGNLSSVTAPILALYGNSDRLVKVYESEQMLLPLRQDPPPPFGKAKLTTLILKGLTHAAIVEAPEKIAAQILPWVWAHQKATPALNPLILPAYVTGYRLKDDGTVTAKKSDLIGKAHGLDTGMDVVEGQKLTIKSDPDVLWKDATMEACTAGGCIKNGLAQALAKCTLILRTTGGKRVPYFTLLTHVKRKDGSSITTVAGFKKIETQPEVTFTAPASGRLYLSANDATLFQPKVIFTNNTGSLKLVIQR